MHRSQGVKRKHAAVPNPKPVKAQKPSLLPELIAGPPPAHAALAKPQAAPNARLQCMADDKARAEALKVEGNAFLKAKDYASAESCYTQALALDPSVEAFYTNRCLVRTHQRKFDAAIADCRAALQLNPRSAKAYGRMGSTQFQAGRYALSVEAYQSALSIEPGNTTYQQGLEVAEGALAGPTAAAPDTVSQLQSIIKAAAAGPTSAKVASAVDALTTLVHAST